MPYLIARGRARRAPGGAQQHPLVVRRRGEAGVTVDPLSHSPTDAPPPTHLGSMDGWMDGWMNLGETDPGAGIH